MFLFMISTAHAANMASTAKDATTGGLSDFFMKMVTAIPFWIAAACVFAVSFYVAAIVKKMVSFRFSKREDAAPEVLILIERAVYSGIIVLGMIISFQIVGINIASLFAFLGVGIGFAMKDFLANFLAGVMILTQKKFKIGDTVDIEGIKGKITEIDSRITQVKGFDGTNLIVPNAKMLSSVIQNFSANEFRRICFDVGVHYDTPLQESIDLAIKSIQKSRDIIPEPPVQVLATSFADSAIILSCRFWVQSNVFWPHIQSKIIQQLKNDFDKAGIIIPFPIRTLALDENDKNLMGAINSHVKTDSEKAHIKGYDSKTVIPQASERELGKNLVPQNEIKSEELIGVKRAQ